MLFKSRRAQRRVLLATALCAGAVGVIPAAAQATGGSSNASLPNVMTRNLYLGADLNPAIGAIRQCQGNPPAIPPLPPLQCQGLLLATNQGIWNKVVATDFPARAKKLAKEIDDNDPYLVGLQEVALWRSAPADGTGPNANTTVEYDFLASLLSELSARGAKYKAAVVQEEADIESPSAPPPTFNPVTDRRLTMRDVILVRTDLPKALVSFTNPQSGNYCVSNCVGSPPRTIVLPTGTGYGDIVFKRGWTSIDIKILGHAAVRFVNTHLESAASGIRQLQAAELSGAFGTGPLLTSMPTVLVGDLNSDPSIAFGGDPTSGESDGAAYNILASAGFAETGNTANTFGHAADLLDAPPAVFTERIDHIMTRPSSVGIWNTKLVGNDPANRAPSAAGLLWPSDHGGLVSTLGF